MDDSADFEQHKKCQKYIKFNLFLAPMTDRRSRAARMMLGLGHIYIRNIEGSRSKGGSMEDRRTYFLHPYMTSGIVEMALQLSSGNISKLCRISLCKWHNSVINKVLCSKIFILRKDIYNRECIQNEIIASIDFFDLTICFMLSDTCPSNKNQDPVRKLRQRIHDSLLVQNPAQFRCIAFHRQVASSFAGWIYWTFWSGVSESGIHRQFRN
jgi:hypothetical protein